MKLNQLFHMFGAIHPYISPVIALVNQLVGRLDGVVSYLDDLADDDRIPYRKISAGLVCAETAFEWWLACASFSVPFGAS